jgi:hypothetical protein
MYRREMRAGPAAGVKPPEQITRRCDFIVTVAAQRDDAPTAGLGGYGWSWRMPPFIPQVFRPTAIPAPSYAGRWARTPAPVALPKFAMRTRFAERE